MRSDSIRPDGLSGRNRRLLHEWRTLEERFGARKDIDVQVAACNAEGLPVRYRVDYHLHSICGVEQVERLGERGVENPPLFADTFRMEIELPAGYPCVDGAPVFRFETSDGQGHAVPHPWHPNIRWFGPMAGRVCLNQGDTYMDLAWGVDRIARYLTYELYHAVAEPPFPEDMQVAAWVVRQGDPREWIYFEQS